MRGEEENGDGEAGQGEGEDLRGKKFGSGRLLRLLLLASDGGRASGRGRQPAQNTYNPERLGILHAQLSTGQLLLTEHPLRCSGDKLTA